MAGLQVGLAPVLSRAFLKNLLINAGCIFNGKPLACMQLLMFSVLFASNMKNPAGLA